VIEDDDGTELKIVRHNMPFGELGKGEFGTYFIGYSRAPGVTEQMLRNMFHGDPPGNTDRVLDFSAAVTGGLFFSPTVDFLDDPPPMPAPLETAQPVIPASDNGSLSIGSLKGIPQ
jgi:putative iron-dependent peroxidase